MNNRIATAAAAAMGLAMASAPAMAQGAPAAPAAPAAEAAPVSDAEVDQFATAAMSLQQIQQDQASSNEEKQTKMAAAVQGSGLSPERFNEIALASRTDTELMQRIQTAAASKAGGA